MGARNFLTVVALALGANAAHAETNDLVAMAPASDWVIDYDDDSCALRRSFQAGSDQAVLELRQNGPGDYFQVRLVSTTMALTKKAPMVRFEPGEAFFEPQGALLLDNREMRGILYQESLHPRGDRGDPAPSAWGPAERDLRERAITGLSVINSFRLRFTVQTGEMHGPMKAMRTCLDELLNHWGLDAAVQRSLSRRVRPIDPMNWARRTQASYPIQMIRAGAGGAVAIRLIVSAEGSPTACIPDKGAADPAFQEHACKSAMQYARFEPALDANGNPVASFYSTTISYRTN